MTRTNDRLPRLTDDERRANLGKAMEVRHKRAELKKALKCRKATMADVLNGDDGFVAGMRVLDLIRSMPGYGSARARKLMTRLGIDERRRVGGLGPRQRAKLLDAFGE